MRDPSTRLIHHPYSPPGGFESPQHPVYKASTVIFPNVAALRGRQWKDKSGYTYGLHGTPSTFLLEEKLCELEGGLQCLLVPSGLAAIANVSLSLLKSGDEVLIPENAYGPNKALAMGELKGWGVTNQLYDPMQPTDLERKISDKTKLVWLEAPGSVTMEFPDIVALANLCRKADVIAALDNTWGAGIAFSPFELAQDVGVDISIQALTKFPSGGGDVLMGSVITRDDLLHQQLKMTHMRLGLGVAANDVELILRSLSSIAVRYKAHDIAARELASWCSGRSEVLQVLHPALSAAPGHAYWKGLCGETLGSAAGLFSIVLDEKFSQSQIDMFCDQLKLFKLGFSWAGPVSLVVPYDLAALRSPWPASVRRGYLVRFSVGLESVSDLVADLEQAMAAAF